MNFRDAESFQCCWNTRSMPWPCWSQGWSTLEQNKIWKVTRYPHLKVYPLMELCTQEILRNGLLRNALELAPHIVRRENILVPYTSNNQKALHSPAKSVMSCLIFYRLLQHCQFNFILHSPPPWNQTIIIIFHNHTFLYVWGSLSRFETDCKRKPSGPHCVYKCCLQLTCYLQLFHWQVLYIAVFFIRYLFNIWQQHMLSYNDNNPLINAFSPILQRAMHVVKTAVLHTMFTMRQVVWIK